MYHVNMKMSKRGNLSTDTITKAILGMILITVLFLVVANLLPTAQEAGDTLNESGAPLSSLFAGNSVIFVIIMAGILLVVVKAVLPRK